LGRLALWSAASLRPATVNDDQGSIAIVLDLVKPPSPVKGSGTGVGISSLMKPNEVISASMYLARDGPARCPVQSGSKEVRRIRDATGRTSEVKERYCCSISFIAARRLRTLSPTPRPQPQQIGNPEPISRKQAPEASPPSEAFLWCETSENHIPRWTGIGARRGWISTNGHERL
jgi:hypothetical protein